VQTRLVCTPLTITAARRDLRNSGGYTSVIRNISYHWCPMGLMGTL
jgi:hypothetical protein